MSNLIAFMLASWVLIQIPGPSLVLTLSRAVSMGRNDALCTVAGNAVGLMAQVVAVSLGLGAVVAASATAFTVLKVAGAAYVIWLGLQTIRHRSAAREMMAARSSSRPSSLAHSLRTGALVGATNPKTVVFFVSFLPQFAGAHPSAGQLMAFGAVFCAMAAVSDSMYAVLASQARVWFARKPERLDHITAAGGAIMIGLGVTTAAARRAH